MQAITIQALLGGVDLRDAELIANTEAIAASLNAARLTCVWARPRASAAHRLKAPVEHGFFLKKECRLVYTAVLDVPGKKNSTRIPPKIQFSPGGVDPRDAGPIADTQRPSPPA